LTAIAAELQRWYFGQRSDRLEATEEDPYELTF
jgi:hypothetical protein